MTGIVEGNSGAENKGKWDVAAVPGGGGNWGGSWLAVPAQSKYPEEAAKLAEFLTNAHQPGGGLQAQGPTADEPDQALENPDFQAYTNAYFSDAPTGKIFGESVARHQAAHLGPKHAAVKERALEPALQAYEGGQASAADGVGAVPHGRPDPGRLTRAQH